MNPIDWRRIAEPQADGYDIRVTLQALQSSKYAQKPARPVPPDAKPVWPEGLAKFVHLSDHSSPSCELRDMPLDHPNAVAGLRLIDTWPLIRQHCAHLTIGLAVLTSGRPQDGHGCTCGNFGDDWGWIYVSADNAWGLAEGIVHEMAHWKLRAFGIQFEDWTPELLAHSFDERFVSPVRKDMPRPMGAVLHAQYSYVHVAAMCTAMLKATPNANGGDHDWTGLQISRIQEGRNTLRQARGTVAGKAFLEGLDDWTRRVINDGIAALDPAVVKQYKLEEAQ